MMGVTVTPRTIPSNCLFLLKSRSKSESVALLAPLYIIIIIIYNYLTKYCKMLT